MGWKLNHYQTHTYLPIQGTLSFNQFLYNTTGLRINQLEPVLTYMSLDVNQSRNELTDIYRQYYNGRQPELLRHKILVCLKEQGKRYIATQMWRTKTQGDRLTQGIPQGDSPT